MIRLGSRSRQQIQRASTSGRGGFGAGFCLVTSGRQRHYCKVLRETQDFCLTIYERSADQRRLYCPAFFPFCGSDLRVTWRPAKYGAKDQGIKRQDTPYVGSVADCCPQTGISGQSRRGACAPVASIAYGALQRRVFGQRQKLPPGSYDAAAIVPLSSLNWVWDRD